jgi:hypothetical protein
MLSGGMVTIQHSSTIFANMNPNLLAVSQSRFINLRDPRHHFSFNSEPAIHFVLTSLLA